MVKQKDIREITELYTLKLFVTGSESINYSILQMLPATTEEIMKEVGLTKMPFYARMNALADANLIEWHKCHGRVSLPVVKKTELTDKFLEAIEIAQKYVGSHIVEYMKRNVGA